MTEEKKSIFYSFSEVMDSCIEKRCISNELIKLHQRAIDRFNYFEEQSMKEEDVINALKLFSASRTCKSVLPNTAKELEKAKSRRENPKTLEELVGILTAIIELGEELESIFNGNEKCFDIESIRDVTLSLQEESENRKLLEPIKERIKKAPLEIRHSIIQKLSPL